MIGICILMNSFNGNVHYLWLKGKKNFCLFICISMEEMVIISDNSFMHNTVNSLTLFE